MQPAADNQGKPSAPFAVRDAFEFVQRNVAAVAIVSILLLIPCFWHSHIQAGDLGSHVYNAWLAQLAEKGQAPGIVVVRQWNNVLFDFALEYGAKLLGWHGAERLAVSLSVLIFFWGTFAFLAAVAKHVPWILLPCLAMLAYGYSFSMGFFNYYLSIGLASFALAAVWRGGAGNWVTAAIVSPLILLAHPIGFLWFVATAAYVSLWRLIPEYWRLILPILVILTYVGLKAFFLRSEEFESSWRSDAFYWMNGSDQMMLFGHRYLVLARVALAWGLVCFLPAFASAIRAGRESSRIFRLPIELYVVGLTAAAFLPENIHSDLFAGWIGLLVSRLTTITAIFGLCVLALLPLRKWHAAGFAAIAVVFFAWTYRDTGTIARVERNAEALVSGLPRGTRIVPVVSAPDDWRVQFIAHSVERACIGRCFSYSNYEPSSGQFRVRALPGSPIATDSADKSEDMSGGDYVVQPEDLQLVSIYQCLDTDWTVLCADPLRAGNKTEDPEPAAQPEK
ncbi:MAG: hypothetical protein NVS9B14_15980 [Candidatus Acidiferrum sp.]